MPGPGVPVFGLGSQAAWHSAGVGAGQRAGAGSVGLEDLWASEAARRAAKMFQDRCGVAGLLRRVGRCTLAVCLQPRCG